MGWSSSVSVWVQFSTDGSPLALWLYSSEQYSVHRFSIYSFCGAFSWTILDSSRFPLFHSGQVFHHFGMPSYCCSSSDFLQSHYTVLLSSFFFSLFHAPLDVVHFLVFLRSFRLNFFLLSSLLLSHRSRISAVIQSFFFWRCLPRISLAVSVTAVLKVVIIESMSVFSLLMMVRGASLPPIIA